MTRRRGELRRWMFDHALPFWAEAGPDRRFGGFREALSFDGEDANLAFKRTRVTCRQIYVFAHAALLGWTDGVELIHRGAEFLRERAWLGPDRGYARRLTQSGELLDPTPDLYDHAFVLFAFAWAFRATGETAYREFAGEALETIDNLFRHPGSGGFHHAIPPAAWRLQNPHMHLLEACLIGFEATGEDRYQTQALEIVELFQTNFFNRETGALCERFADDWSRAPGQDGQIAEPGHQYEWAWILESCGRLIGADVEPDIRMLIVLTEAVGLNAKTGLVMNSILPEGSHVDAGSRTWPNTERIKAGVAAMRLGIDGGSAMVEGSVDQLLDRYLSPQPGFPIPKGAWIDAFDAAGVPTSADVPASTLYHLFFAFAEALAGGGAAVETIPEK